MIEKGTKILVTGCGGMLGDAIYNYFKDKCILYPTDINLNEPWLQHLDVTNYQQFLDFTLKVKPDYIFHLAALTDVDHCETKPTEAYKTNAFGTENAALISHKLNITMIYVSTAGVFSMDAEEYTDYETPNPMSVYGKSKYAGERFVKEILNKYFIFRAGWMIGGGPKKDKKFVNKIIQQLKEGKKELFVVEDKTGSPTYTYDLAKTIHHVINSGHYGLYNAACQGGASRFDIAKAILDIKGLNGTVILNKVDSAHFMKEYFAPRPGSEKLVNLKLKMRDLDINRDWKECLQEYLDMHDWGI